MVRSRGGMKMLARTPPRTILTRMLLRLTVGTAPALLFGCLEKVTGEHVPLDARFYEGGQGDPRSSEGKAEGDPNNNGAGDAPFFGVEGERMEIVGVVETPGEGPIQMDVNEADATAPGGQKRAGAVHLPGGGPFSLEVPVATKELRLQIFQDPDGDGPSDTDPFAEVRLPLDGKPPEPLKILLKVGGRGQAGGTGGGAPGSPGGDPNGGSPGGGSPGGGAPDGGAPGNGAPGGAPPPPAGLSFPDGPRVTLTGNVVAPGPVVLDVFKRDPAAAGGRTFLGKVSAAPGAFTQEFPKDYGEVDIEAYRDLLGDGFTADDPKVAAVPSPVVVGGDDPLPVEIRFP